MGAFVGALIALGAVGAFLGTRGAGSGAVTESEPSLRAQLAVASRNRPFRLLLTCFVVQAAGTATMLAGVKYFAEHVLRRPEDGPTLLFACFVGPALLVMPVWSRIGARVGKARAYVWASLTFAAGALALVAAPVLPPVGAYLITAVIGCGYAGQQVFGLAMLPDCIAYDTARTGRRQAGVFTGLWTAGETFGLALGPGLYALVLQVSGYVSSDTGQAAAQDAGARAGVLLGFTALPAVVVGLAVLLLRGYDLTPRKLASAGAVGSVTS
jgi:Na+/melibiose symporter-like transporter